MTSVFAITTIMYENDSELPEIGAFGAKPVEDAASDDAAEIPESSDDRTVSAVSSEIKPAVVSRDEGLLALVLDDCGGNMEMARRVQSLDLPITWAIIPNLRHSAETADMLREAAVPFLVHVPMQALSDPDDKRGNPKYFYIGSGMSGSEVKNALAPLLDSLPGAYGINNHRGSKATADMAVMKSVMDVLAERGMFFMDSRTTPKSVAHKAALERGLKTARNSIFLDNYSDRQKIAFQMKEATALAKKNGSAVAICHLRPETVAFLEGFSAEYAAIKGVRLVTLPQLLEER
jgi:polysaccharide deacetylase 2 family uncharacterized protein YibQ